jgi:hypothetical protein
MDAASHDVGGEKVSLNQGWSDGEGWVKGHGPSRYAELSLCRIDGRVSLLAEPIESLDNDWVEGCLLSCLASADRTNV